MDQSAKTGVTPVARTILSPLIHGRVRLLILSTLMRAKRPSAFTALREELGLTDGSLSVHLSKLEEGGLVMMQKTFVGKRPLTSVKITAKGRRQFKKYVSELMEIVPGLMDV